MPWSRREFLGSGAAAIFAARMPGNARAAGTPNAARPRAGSGALDAALEILGPTGPEYHGGLANHGPMAAEALVALDRPEAVVPWVERYRRLLDSRPRGGRPIAAADWREALGEGSRLGDWLLFFEREVEARGWKAALADWSDRLAPGVAAAAFHGVIRTGHAVRALEEREDAPRRRELASGLAYWAARYQALPEAASGARGLPSQVIAEVPVLPPGDRTRGFIAHRLDRLGRLASFPAVAGMADTTGDPSKFLSDLTETFAGLYLDHAGGNATIGMIHAVTGPSAVRLILPHASPAGRGRLLRYTWQAAAALYAIDAKSAPNPRESGELPPAVDLIDRAVATQDEHGFKFTEACLREHALNPRPVYLAASLDSSRRLG
jgi:hypothetical protein